MAVYTKSVIFPVRIYGKRKKEVNGKVRTPLMVLTLYLLFTDGLCQACTWAAFAKGKVAIVVRTMDWMYDDHAIVKGYGRNMTATAADTPNGLRYTSKYARIQNSGTYYMWRTNSWCSEIYDFSMFAREKPETVVLRAADCPYGPVEGDEAAADCSVGTASPAAAPKSDTSVVATTEVLLKTTASWDGVPYTSYPAGIPELTLVRIVIPANSILPWHTHPMPNAAYIVRGELTVVQHETGLTRKLIGGQTLPEMVDAVHRGYSASDPVELLVFYAGAPEMPLSEPAKVE